MKSEVLLCEPDFVGWIACSPNRNKPPVKRHRKKQIREWDELDVDAGELCLEERVAQASENVPDLVRNRNGDRRVRGAGWVFAGVRARVVGDVRVVGHGPRG